MSAPVVIEVSDLYKTFHLPDKRRLEVLRGVSFDVREGEFFGVVGRNGSGKSTLLKVLASIYRADAGRIRMAGRLAPFIELGVGFNLELTARENVVLNGVMMGLGRREAAARLDGVLAFAELEDFVDLKLKNYSSGMLVRLAFAAMVEADADVMLVDEVLAVGDASFAQKCMDVFREKRRQGRTLVLVTHDMATVQSFCDRAMLIHDGEQQYLGDPEEAALRYFRLNFGGEINAAARGAAVPDVNVKLHDVWLEDGEGKRVEGVEQGKPLYFHMLCEARQELIDPVFNFHVVNADGAWVFGFSTPVSLGARNTDRLQPGEQVRLQGRVENPLLPGRYSLECWVSRRHDEGHVGLHVLRLMDLFVYGTRPGDGSVSFDADVSAVLEPAGS